MGAVSMRRRREGGMGMRQQWGGQRTSRDQKVGRGAAKFIKTSERKRMDVEGGRGGIGSGPEKDRWYITWQDFFFLLGSGTCCPYRVSLAHNILPRERERWKRRGWCRKLMEDVTNHKISDKSIVSSNHANNLECIFSFSFIMVHLSSRKTQGQISFKAYSHTALIICHQ